jgi:hypothetical protein
MMPGRRYRNRQKYCAEVLIGSVTPDDSVTPATLQKVMKQVLSCVHYRAAQRRTAMRPKALAIVSTFVMLATSPAFAQMTEQNRQNQGSAANPLGESSVNHGAVTTGPAASAHAVPKSGVPAGMRGGRPGIEAKRGTVDAHGAEPPNRASQ